MEFSKEEESYIQSIVKQPSVHEKARRYTRAVESINKAKLQLVNDTSARATVMDRVLTDMLELLEGGND